MPTFRNIGLNAMMCVDRRGNAGKVEQLEVRGRVRLKLEQLAGRKLPFLDEGKVCSQPPTTYS